MSSPQHEPTMEEILASIRKIISEDSPAAPQPEADVLELTQEVTEVPPPAEAALEPAPPPHQVVMEEPASPHSDIFSDHTRKAMEDTFARIPDAAEDEAPAPQPAAVPVPPVAGASVESVFERAVRESFEPVLRQHLADNSAAVIEGMKPLIREWMDEHFPPLLEGAVRAEVERVVKARGTRR